MGQWVKLLVKVIIACVSFSALNLLVTMTCLVWLLFHFTELEFP